MAHDLALVLIVSITVVCTALLDYTETDAFADMDYSGDSQYLKFASGDVRMGPYGYVVLMYVEMGEGMR